MPRRKSTGGFAMGTRVHLVLVPLVDEPASIGNFKRFVKRCLRGYGMRCLSISDRRVWHEGGRRARSFPPARQRQQQRRAA